MNVIRWMDSFLPDRVRSNEADRVRARVLVFSMFFLGCFGCLYNLLYFLSGNPFGGGVILFEVVCVWSLPFYFRRGGDMERTTNLYCLSFTFMMTVLLLSSGGATYSSNPWWTIVPVFATLILGSRIGRRWLALVLSILGAAYVVELAGFEFPDYIRREGGYAFWAKLLDWFHFFGCILIVTIPALVFDHINQAAMQAQSESLAQTRVANQRSEEQNHYLGECVERILGQMDALAEGRLTARLKHEREDEIGRLCQGFNQAVARVREAIEEITSAASVTTHTTGEIKGATGQLADGASRQNRRAHDLVTAIEEMVAISKYNTDHAHSTAQAAQANGQVAEEGGTVVQQTMHKMEDIAEVVNRSVVSVERLGRAGEEIGEIVRVINDIAGKTNLLALNATIEAAHAGEAGRGFAVIAGEVKELAEQTSLSTAKIAKMIAAVQRETQEVSEEMRQGSAMVGVGKALAQQAGEALEHIVHSSAEVTRLVQQIAQESARQSEKAQGIFTQIDEMRRITESSNHEIKGIVHSSEQLGGMTQRLREQISHFQLT